MKFSIIIFCYNEGGNVSKVIPAVVNLMEEIAEDYEIIIVEDGSTDNTYEVCQKFAAQHPKIQLIKHAANLGIGMALRSGYQRAKFTYVCAVPGDAQFNVNELKQVTPFGPDTYYSFYRLQTNYNFYRAFLSWSNRLFNQHVLGVYLRDVNWIKVFHIEHIRNINIELTSSLVESERCAKLYQCKIMPIEIPSHYLPRNYGKAKGGNWKSFKGALSEMFQLWWCIVKFKPGGRF